MASHSGNKGQLRWVRWMGVVIHLCARMVLVAGVSDPSEVNCLAIFKQATGNVPTLANWQGNDPCGDSWQGVTCTPANGNSTQHMTQLQLPNAGLSGNIPRVISQLSQLQVLDLSNNRLLGPIPIEMGNLPNLQTLDLHSNAIVSTLDPWLVQLTQLTALDLSSNQIWGYLPPGISALTNLQTLNLAENNVAGPVLPALGQLSNLSMLVLYANKFNGPVPPELGNLTKAYGMLLHNNSLTGTIPVELANCKILGWLFLHNNQLTGAIPQALTLEPQLVARYDGNPLCQNAANAVYCLVNPKAAPPAPPEAMTTLAAANVGGPNGTCVSNAPCTCPNGKVGTNRCDGPDTVCDCGGHGFQWSKTDTIITVVVCLAFGMLVKTVLLIWYLRRKYRRQHRKEDLFMEGGEKGLPTGQFALDIAKPEHSFDPKGGVYYPMAGTPSETSSESFQNRSAGSDTKLLQVVVKDGSGNGDGNDKWRRGTIGDVLKRNAEKAASVETSDEGTDQFSPADYDSRDSRFRSTDSSQSGSVPLLFTYKELQGATQSFSPTLLIGEGGFGRVYYGVVDGREVAVKRLEKATTLPGKHGEKQFRVEVDVMSRLQHPNLLEFIGYCADRNERALVYPLMVNQSLFRRLHDRASDETPPLGAARRMTIAYQAARALAYLHDEAKPQVIHRDFNSSNILLDSNLDAKVSDFGLAKLVSDDSGMSQTSKLFGTMGYMAPEYLHGQVTDKNDVYSFGVVLLELISGRRAIISKDLDLVHWAAGYTRRANPVAPLARMADPEIQNEFPADALQWAVEVAGACVESDPRKRPSMADVARGLEVILQAFRQQSQTGVQTSATPGPVPESPGPYDDIVFSPDFSMTEFLKNLEKR